MIKDIGMIYSTRFIIFAVLFLSTHHKFYFIPKCVMLLVKGVVMAVTICYMKFRITCAKIYFTFVSPPSDTVLIIHKYQVTFELYLTRNYYSRNMNHLYLFCCVDDRLLTFDYGF